MTLAKDERQIAEYETLLEGTVFQKRKRGLLIRLSNQQQGEVREPIFIQSDMKSMVQQIKVSVKEPTGKEKTRIWTRMFSTTDLATMLLFPGSVNDHVYPGNKYELLEYYETLKKLAAMAFFIAYTVLWFTLSFKTGTTNLTWGLIWKSGWIPLAIGIMIPSGLFYYSTQKDTDLDILELTVQDENRDQDGRVAYWCRPSVWTTEKEMEYYGAKTPEGWFDTIRGTLDKIKEYSGEEFKNMEARAVHLTGERNHLLNQLSSSSARVMTDRERSRRWNDSMQIAKIGMWLCFFGLMYFTYLKYGG